MRYTNKRQDNSNGFTAVELLITLFIAAAFLMSGYQLYSVIIKDGGETRAKAKASNIAYDYLQRYKSVASNPCSLKTPATDQSVATTDLSNVLVSVSITCPYGAASTISKVSVTLKYNDPQQTINNSTFNIGPCTAGYILVPGSTTYGTKDFCVMKYEAKNVSGVATSQAAATPWVAISQTNAITTAAAACAGCHLITEAEWLTIAQNVLSIADNWSGRSVGSGYIYSGHNDGDPATIQAADASDANGYTGTNDSSGDTGVTNTMIGNTQRRTLKLTNNEVIWDLAGNVFEWTDGRTNGTSAQQPGIVGNNFSSLIQWNSATTQGTLNVNPFPSYGTTLASGWTSTNGLGQLFSGISDTALRGFIRGGGLTNTVHAGIYAIDFQYAPSYTDTDLGFRVSKTI